MSGLVGLALILDHSNKNALTITRKNDHTKIGLPGGKMEEQDISLKHTTARELYEETGVIVDPNTGIYIYGGYDVENFWVETWWFPNPVNNDPEMLIQKPNEGIPQWRPLSDLIFHSPYSQYNREVLGRWFTKMLEYSAR